MLRISRDPWAGPESFRRLLDLAGQDASPKGRRDLVALRLLWDLALRREEVVSLDVEHVDLAAGTLSILGKGRREREILSLPAASAAALRAWLEVRGTAPGPLVLNMDRRTKGERLSGAGLYHIIQELGRRVDLTVRPHGIRHAAITEALEKTGGNVRAVQRFSRHRDLPRAARQRHGEPHPLPDRAPPGRGPRLPRRTKRQGSGRITEGYLVAAAQNRGEVESQGHTSLSPESRLAVL